MNCKLDQSMSGDALTSRCSLVFVFSRLVNEIFFCRRYFLEAGDAFLRSLENPSHVVLFEKLFRRILVNVERNASLSILCTQCLCR